MSDFGNAPEFGFGLGPDQPPTSLAFKKEFQREMFYQMSPQEVINDSNNSIMI